MENERAPLSSRLVLRGAVREVTLSRASLTWTELSSEKARRDAPRAGNNRVPVCEIIAAREIETAIQTKNKGSGPSISQELLRAYPSAFTVSFVERASHHHWRTSDVTFHCPSAATCHQWVQTITGHLEMLSGRPRRLLVYINPYGGKQQGKRIYEQRVAPLFARASISTHVIVTQLANQARDELTSSADLNKYDGVVCVGGDGMFSEVIHGLIARTQRNVGLDQNCAEEKLAPCMLRVGIIPAGSTDCICYASVGTNDPVTSALHIILGDSQPMDVCSVHHNDKLLRYSMSLLGYGFYGDVLADSEAKRWMGPARYSFSGLKTFLLRHLYEGTVSFLPATDILGSPRDKTRCRAGCPLCQHNRQLASEDGQVCRTDENIAEKEHQHEWQVVHGKFRAINAATMSCACPRSPDGLSPAAHLGDGTTDLILVHGCSSLGFLRHLLRHTNQKDQFDMDFVEVHRVRRFRFTPKRGPSRPEAERKPSSKKVLEQMRRDHRACSVPFNSTWNCDGEILHPAAVEVRVHCGLIRLFARGIEDQAPPAQLSSPCAT